MLYFCSVGLDDKIGELAIYIYIYVLYFCSVGGDDKIGELAVYIYIYVVFL